jgi:hypothetical protein
MIKVCYSTCSKHMHTHLCIYSLTLSYLVCLSIHTYTHTTCCYYIYAYGYEFVLILLQVCFYGIYGLQHWMDGGRIEGKKCKIIFFLSSSCMFLCFCKNLLEVTLMCHSNQWLCTNKYFPPHIGPTYSTYRATEY